MKFISKIFVILFLLPFTSQAQNLEGGLALGLMTYQGDLVDNYFAEEEFNFFYGVVLRYHLTEKISLKGNFFAGRLTGDDANSSLPGRRAREFKFKSDILELGLQGEWNFLGDGRYDRRGVATKQQFTPYLFGGLGAAFTKPEVFKGTEPDPEGTDYDTYHIIVPAGAGAKIGLTERIIFGIEIGGRATFSDYLDGISKLGNSGANDWYWTGNILMTYTFGSPNLF